MKYRRKWNKTIHLLMSVMLAIGILTASVPVFGLSSEEISTSYCEDSDISLKIRQDRMLEVEVPQDNRFAYLIVTFMDSDGGVPDAAQPVKVINGTAVYDFSDKEDGVYYVQLYRNDDVQGTFEGVIGGMESVAVKIRDGSAEIIPSAVYDENLIQYQKQAVSADALCYYLKPSSRVQSDDEKIASTAGEITKGMTDSYDKVRAIHDWVASNLYFDYDALSQQGQQWPKDALGALESRRTVCEGYANLTTALLRASGIPAKTVIGYALYGSEHTWNTSNLQGNRANHAWTAAFADGRWILMDPTWDSGNYYRNGEYHTSEEVHTYFDSTLEFFSYNHRQTRRDFYDSGYVKKEFSDIRDHWGFDAIRFVINNDLMIGTSDNEFQPDAYVTQAMFLSVLARMSGDDVPDSDDGNWYDSAVKWADEKGILKGVEEIFSPEENIERQTMAVMLDNYMKYKGNEFGENIYGTESGKEDNDSGSQMEGSLSSVRQSVFADEEMIAAWAKESVHSTVDSGILQGRSDGTFGPHDSFTRAEMSVVAERICYRELLSRLG